MALRLSQLELASTFTFTTFVLSELGFKMHPKKNNHGKSFQKPHP